MKVEQYGDYRSFLSLLVDSEDITIALVLITLACRTARIHRVKTPLRYKPGVPLSSAKGYRTEMWEKERRLVDFASASIVVMTCISPTFSKRWGIK